MKILYHHRTLGDGAEGVHIKEMVKAFRNLGHKVKVVAPIGENTNAVNSKVSLFSRIKGFFPKILYEFLEIGYNLYGYYLLRKEIIKERPDFIYDRYITFNASSVLIGKKYDIPIILEVNAPLALERSKQNDERLYLKKVAFFLEKWICSNSSKTVVVSTPLKDYLVSLTIPPKKIIVIPNGVDIKKFRPCIKKDKKLLQKCGFDEQNVIVGFAGILRPWHGLDLLLGAFKLVENNDGNIRLLIVGDGPIRSGIEEEVDKLSLSDKVFITGRISHDSITNYIALFDIAVSSKTTFYASPMKILEYMAMGKAVIASNTQNIKDIIDNNVNGLLFESDNYSKLALGIRKLVFDKALRHKLGQKAYDKIIFERTWEHNALRIVKIIEQKQELDIAFN